MDVNVRWEFTAFFFFGQRFRAADFQLVCGTVFRYVWELTTILLKQVIRLCFYYYHVKLH